MDQIELTYLTSITPEPGAWWSWHPQYEYSLSSRVTTAFLALLESYLLREEFLAAPKPQKTKLHKEQQQQELKYRALKSQLSVDFPVKAMQGPLSSEQVWTLFMRELLRDVITNQRLAPDTDIHIRLQKPTPAQARVLAGTKILSFASAKKV